MRYMVPLTTHTVARVLYERFEKLLFKGCIWHFTSYANAGEIYQSGWMRQGRDAIYWLWNLQFLHVRDEYKDHAQVTGPIQPLKYKEKIRSVKYHRDLKDDKRAIGIGFDFKLLLNSIPQLNLVQVASGAFISPISEFQVEQLVTNCVWVTG